MSETAVIAIIAVASTLFLAAGAAIWRLAASDAEKTQLIKQLRLDVDRLTGSVAKIDSDADLQHREDERQWRAWTEIISTLRAEWKALRQAPLRRSNPRVRPDEEP